MKVRDGILHYTFLTFTEVESVHLGIIIIIISSAVFILSYFQPSVDQMRHNLECLLGVTSTIQKKEVMCFIIEIPEALNYIQLYSYNRCLFTL